MMSTLGLEAPCDEVRAMPHITAAKRAGLKVTGESAWRVAKWRPSTDLGF